MSGIPDRVTVIVNGLPGAGKTTVATALAGQLRLPLLSKDIVKEKLGDVLGAERPAGAEGPVGPPWQRALGEASAEILWSLLGHSPVGAVLEAPWLASARPLVVAGLTRAGVDPRDVIEVWCDVEPALARQRFEARAARRHAVHGPQVDNPNWDRWVVEAEPLGLGAVLRVDTTWPAGCASIAAWVRRTAERGVFASPKPA